MSEPPPAAPQPPAPSADERYGPLLVRRMLKEDGRALIRYERAEEPRP